MSKVVEAIEASNQKSKGRPSHRPTVETRNIVVMMSGVGLSEALICSALQITDKTLRKHYRKEIDCAQSRFHAQLISNMVILSQGKDGTAFRANEFLLQTRFGYSRYAAPIIPKDPVLGKKEQLDMAAKTGHEDSEWGELLN